MWAAKQGHAGSPPLFGLVLENSRKQAVGLGEDPSPQEVNYYRGTDRRRWRERLRPYRQVRFRDVYPGITLVWKAEADLRFEFRLAAHADPEKIRFHLVGDARASLEPSGDLVLSASTGVVRYSRPVAFQWVNGIRRQVESRFRLGPGAIGFSLGRYDRTLPLLIDPVIRYESYLGGAGYDAVSAVVVDSSGHIYLSGETSSCRFPPATGESCGVRTHRDTFVTKLSPDGSTVLYTTVLSATANSAGRAIALGADGSVWVAGSVNGTGFPVTADAPQSDFGPVQSGFLARLNASGQLIFATYLGRDGTAVNGIAVHGDDIFLAGTTSSSRFPTTSDAMQPAFKGGLQDAFLVTWSQTSHTISYASYLGGSGNDVGQAIAADPAGNRCLTGFTDSMDLPLHSALQPSKRGSGDAFVACLSASGVLTFSTYLGGSGHDVANAIAMDNQGTAYIAGSTNSADFPATFRAKNGSTVGDYSAFVTKLQPQGTVSYSSVLGGSGTDAGTGIAAGSNGRVWLAGYTSSPDVPSIAPWGPNYRGGFDAFACELESGGSLRGCGYLGGTSDDRAMAVAADGSAGAVVVGYTSSPGLPVSAGALQPSSMGSYDGFVCWIAAQGTISGRLLTAGGQPVPGATVTASGPIVATATADSAGYFHVDSLPDGSYTVVPAASGYSFSPPYLQASPSGTSLLSFTATSTSGGSLVNLALAKTAAQSSTYSSSTAAGRGNDGNTDGAFSAGSLSLTNLQSTPWWQVDLGASVQIDSIQIWNRTDCCGDRLSDYWIFVSDTPFSAGDTPATLQNRAGTWRSHQTTAPNPSATIAVGQQGRYVRIQLSGTNYLTLAEVQVMGVAPTTSSNLALGKAAAQSSEYASSTSAGRGNDGNTDGAISAGSLSLTNLQSTPWWQIDLGASAQIDSIQIWNRTDCCGDRLSDYWVFVSDTPFSAGDTPATLQNRAGTWRSHQTTAPNPSATIAVGQQGRYVRIQLSGTNYLTLAEVQVMGVAAP